MNFMQLFSFLAVSYAYVGAYGFRLAPQRGGIHQKTNMNMMLNIFGGTKQSSSSSLPTNKKLCVITGTSSGLGKETAKVLLQRDDYFVICACRDVEKMKQVAEKEGFDDSKYKIMELNLSSFDSVRKFANDLKKIKSKPLDRLVCNAAVYQPALPTVMI
jgi:hypothetical protein